MYVHSLKYSFRVKKETAMQAKKLLKKFKNGDKIFLDNVYHLIQRIFWLILHRIVYIKLKMVMHNSEWYRKLIEIFAYYKQEK